MCGWLLLGLLFPPLLPVVLFLALLDGFGGGRGAPPPLKPALLPKLFQLSPDPHLFQPVTATTDDFMPAKPETTGVEHPGALCPICGAALATGNHAHNG